MAQLRSSRKLRELVSELRDLEEDLVPGLRKKNSQEIKNLTPWAKTKYHAGRELTQLTQDVEELKVLRQSDPKTRETIALAAKCRSATKKMSAIFDQMEIEEAKEFKKAKKMKDLANKAKELKKVKQHMLIRENFKAQFASLLLKISKGADTVQVQKQEKKRSQAAKEKINNDVNEQLQKVDEAKKTGKTGAQDRRQRRAERKERKRKNMEDTNGTGDIQLQVMSEETEQAMIRVDDEMTKQNEYLDLIEKGVDKLFEVASDIGMEVKKQKMLIDDLDNEMSKVSNEMDAANVKLDKLSAKQDDTVVSCCYKVTCLLVILSLFGYSYYLFF